jgi:hypothetical protein
VLVAVALAAALLALASAAFGLLVLPMVLLSNDPWWWAWVGGAGPTIGLVILAGVGATLEYLRDQQEKAEREDKPLETRGPLWKAAGWALGHQTMLGRSLWPGIPILLLAYAALFWESWPVALVAVLVANVVRDNHRAIYAALLVALLGYAAVLWELWPVVVVGILIAFDLLEALCGLLRNKPRRPPASAP